MTHIKNKGIFYVANGTDPNILGITPTSNLGLCKTQDGTKEWNYNDTLAPGSKWVLKDGGKKVYKALLTQSGTDAPVATVLENTLGGEPFYEIHSDGKYNIEGTDLFEGTVVAKILPRYSTILQENNTLFTDYNDNGSVTVNSFIINGVELISSPLNIVADYTFTSEAEAFNNLITSYIDNTHSNVINNFINPFIERYDLSRFIIGAHQIEYNGIVQTLECMQMNVCSIIKNSNSVLSIFTGQGASAPGAYYAPGAYNTVPLRNGLLLNDELVIEVIPK